ncbi:MAG: haloacid dehalogenase-like hydrolase [Nitrososphaerota archaeon]|jgi:dolichol kinase/phosphoserine phosphatase|nr:haloacid dehalogenase-like hydrolase [Nitrososphaerota archaeon]
MSLPKKPRLIVFDVEGVLIPRNRFVFEVGKALGVIRFFRLVFWGFLYEVGFITLESAFRHIFWDLKGVKFECLIDAFSKIPASPYLQSLFRQLKSRNCIIALISSGVPTVLIKKLGDSVGADYVYGIEVEQKDGKLTGAIWGDAITKNGKLKILCEILNRENLLFSDCIVVADDRNNRCIFMPEMLKIGFNPDFIIRIKADRVVNGKLPGILPIIDGKPHRRIFPSANDLVREDIHAAGFFVPIIASMVGTFPVVASIIIIALIYAISELARLEGCMLPLVSTITRRAASPSELYGFAAAPLYFAFGIVTTLLLFPAPISGAAIAMFCLGDSAASLFGGLISTSLPFNKGKTWEGSLAGFIFAFLGGAFFVPPLLALAGAAIAMTIEVLPLPINDNVLVPVITGAAITLLISIV